MNQITDKDDLSRAFLKSIEWDETRQMWRAEIPTVGGIVVWTRTSFFPNILAMNRAFRAAVNPDEGETGRARRARIRDRASPTAIARLLPLYWVGCCTGWRAQIEINGHTLLIGNFRVKSTAQAALDKYFTPTTEKP
jgi:hypothetical protein